MGARDAASRSEVVVSRRAQQAWRRGLSTIANDSAYVCLVAEWAPVV